MIEALLTSLATTRLLHNDFMRKSNRITLTAVLRNTLITEKERTGVAANKLLRGKRGVMPGGLTSSMIAGWMAGRIRTAKKHHLEWVLDAYANYIPPETPVNNTPEKIRLNDIQLALIKSEVQRTGLGAIDVLRHAPKPLPDGLNHQKVQRWISGDTKTAVKAHWDLIMRLYANIGDNSDHPQR